MKVLGLTGGIGSGKSTVAGIFKTLGVPVYNSDERAKELYFVPEIRAQVEELLGAKAYRNKSAINKKYIAEKIFSDKTLLEKLNTIIHPAVGKDFEDFRKQHAKEKYIVKESALLIEAGLLKKVDKLIVVTSDIALRTERIKKRDNLNKEEIEKILKRQLSDSDKIKEADWVIENNEQKLIIPQVLKIHKSLV
ncbi:MAG: dephospho-CoA kinase [Bacteroidia bacterium]